MIGITVNPYITDDMVGPNPDHIDLDSANHATPPSLPHSRLPTFKAIIQRHASQASDRADQDRMWGAPMTPNYPVNLSLTGRAALVVGGGPIAARKASGLLQAGAIVTVVAPTAVEELSSQPDITWHPRPYRRGEAASYWVAITATNDPAVNAQVAADGEAARVWINSADDPDNCSFTLPAVARRGKVQLAISTDGRSPASAKWLRHRFDRELRNGLAELVDLLAEARDETRTVHGTSEVDGWGDALDDGLLELIRSGRISDARNTLRSHLKLEPTS